MTASRLSVSPDEAGYTLLEVLVALALVAILSSIMVTGIFQFRHLLRLEAQIEAKASLRQTVRHVVKLLEQAENIAIPTGGNQGSFLSPMEGGAGEIHFFVTTRRGAYLQGLREVELRIDHIESQRVLTQVMAPRRFDKAADRQEDKIELASQVTELSFAYFGAPDNADEPSWHATWHDARTLPIGISVRLSARHDGSHTTIEEFAYLGVR